MAHDLELTIDSLAFGGDAVARDGDGRVVFVAGGAAPGDRVRVRVEQRKKSHARALLVELIAPGPSRVAPPCPLVARCGGCQWQEVALDAQRAAKQAIVARALGRLGAEVRPIVAPTSGFHYRTRARFSAGDRGVIGYQSRRSHEIVDVPACPQLDPRLEALLAIVRASFAPLLGPGGTASALVGRGGAHLALTGITDDAAAREAARALLAGNALSGVVLEGERLGAHAIDTGDDEEPPFLAAADGFAQASAEGNRALRRLVAEAARAHGLAVLELHAGDGNFTRDLAAVARAVTTVEGDAAAVARQRINAPTATAHAEPVEQAVRRLAASGARFDLVLLDPPRAGAPGLAPSLARLASRIVYVSCDPMTLARDAAELAAAGLPPRRATPIDLMPQTYHVETVCELGSDGGFSPATP